MPIDFVECARTLEGTPPGVHVRGRIGDMHGFVAPGDACEDVDLAADFRADEAGGQANAALTIASEDNLREESAGVRSPVRTDEGALVRASPRQAHDINAAVHRPRARARGQADVSGQDDARDTVFRHGGRRQRAGRVDEDAARFDVDACAIAADVEDAAAWPVGSSLCRAGHGSMPTLARAFSSSICWVVRSVTRAPALMAAAATASIASAKRCSLGAASMRVVPTRE